MTASQTDVGTKQGFSKKNVHQTSFSFELKKCILEISDKKLTEHQNIKQKTEKFFHEIRPQWVRVLFLLLCSIIEAYLNNLSIAQLFTLPVYNAFNSSRTKEKIIAKRRQSFALAFECRQAACEI